ncbi:MAG: 4-hydroxythreonine-4-phosphate dehydrogenase PdxA [Candidatus Omnitrophica bacterium]|nr:4-hydroxythreonine-4-phosphate dehydrogenase PdxA [Candidatus Omnitrophota bacterium]
MRNLTSPMLAITSGDPCGIGPEVILKTLAQPLSRSVKLLVIGDRSVFERTAKALRLRLPSWHLVTPRGMTGTPASLAFVDLAHAHRFTPGHSSAKSGAASLAYLDAALALVRQGAVHGLVTAPVTKWAIARAGKPFAPPLRAGFTGHTDYLAERLGTRPAVMTFVSDALRVVLLTQHLALREVSPQLTKPRIRRTLRVVITSLQRQFRIRRPRLAVCGLNPHAGEDGAFGDEERRLIVPVMREFSRDGVRLEGPFAADGFFVHPHGYDAILCWYHDQGLIPFKLMARDRGCQLTLGLPIVRTSPDHGSALDIAGRGVAHPGSMRYALELAAQLTLKDPIRVR